MLSVERSSEAAARHLIRPERARILPAGAIIVDAILERYGIDRLRVSEEGMREGAVLAAARAGATWRDQLPALVRGWEG
jgi:exopolyphosphatase/pppGpp-phosphohydrolase